MSDLVAVGLTKNGLNFILQKSVDRSWRNVYAVLTSDSLNVYKDKKTATDLHHQVITLIIHHIVRCTSILPHLPS